MFGPDMRTFWLAGIALFGGYAILSALGLSELAWWLTIASGALYLVAGGGAAYVMDVVRGIIPKDAATAA